MTETLQTPLLVVGAGPGGYPAAFLAADLGLSVTVADTEAHPGGVCLYRGCIPSKALLHAARILQDAREAGEIGLRFGEPQIDLAQLREWKEGVVRKLTGGLGQLARQRRVQLLRGQATLQDAHTAEVRQADGATTLVRFEHAILATGSRPAMIPGLPAAPDRIWDSTGALQLAEVPPTLLVIGGGYIGLELGSVYAALGARVTVVEMLPALLPGADRDLVAPLAKRLQSVFHEILLRTKVAEVRMAGAGVEVRFEGPEVKEPVRRFDRVLVAVGRRPNTAGLGLERTRAGLDAKGFVQVDGRRCTAEPSLWAIGDIAGEPMLAHKATHEGRVAAETVAGRKRAYEPRAIPAVVFTDPEIAWCGLTEAEARERQIPVKVAKFPWGASGRALTLNRGDGLAKLVVEPGSERILGVGLAGPGAGELIAEGVLAVEMGANVKDLQLTIHPHPTLSETIMEAAEVFHGQSAHFFQRR